MKSTLFENMKNWIGKHARIRSAWDNGVKAYALDLLEELDWNYYPEELVTSKSVTAAMLNGAKDWKQYSEGGLALVCDVDIALQLCTATELKATRYGARRPNKKESWLEVQARALFQASRIVLQAYEACREYDDDGEPLPRF